MLCQILSLQCVRLSGLGFCFKHFVSSHLVNHLQNVFIDIWKPCLFDVMNMWICACYRRRQFLFLEIKCAACFVMFTLHLVRLLFFLFLLTSLHANLWWRFIYLCEVSATSIQDDEHSGISHWDTMSSLVLPARKDSWMVIRVDQK